MGFTSLPVPGVWKRAAGDTPIAATPEDISGHNNDHAGSTAWQGNTITEQVDRLPTCTCRLTRLLFYLERERLAVAITVHCSWLSDMRVLKASKLFSYQYRMLKHKSDTYMYMYVYTGTNNNGEYVCYLYMGRILV